VGVICCRSVRLLGVLKLVRDRIIHIDRLITEQ